MPRLIMLQGLPASGKTSWAKEKVLKSGGNWKRINKDDLRELVDAGKWSKGNEKDIIKIRDAMITTYMSMGHNIIVDDTNFYPAHKTRLQELCKKHDYQFETKFFDVDLQEAINRDLARENSVGAKVIADMYNRYVKPKVEPEIYEPNSDLPPAVIVDIDGTLAHRTARGPFDWDKVGSDRVDENVASFLNVISEGWGARAILVSGRDSVCRDETEKWLDENDVLYDRLYMREEGDNRKDVIIKREIFDKYIRDNYRVELVLDDRNQTVEGWREMGLTCWQVAPGDF